MEILDDFQIAEPLEDDHIKQTIIDDSVFKKWERPSVKTPVADKNERSFFNGSFLGFDEQLRGLAGGDLRCGDKIAERTKAAFECEAGLFHHLRVQSHPGELDKVSSVRNRQIDLPDICFFDDVPAASEVVQREAELHRKDVYTAHREHA